MGAIHCRIICWEVTYTGGRRGGWAGVIHHGPQLDDGVMLQGRQDDDLPLQFPSLPVIVEGIALGTSTTADQQESGH